MADPAAKTEPTKGAPAKSEPAKAEPPASADPSSAPATEEKKDEPRYPVEQLTTESRAFLGVASHVAVGAFHGEKRKTLTIDEAKERVKKFLKRPASGEEASER